METTTTFTPRNPGRWNRRKQARMNRRTRCNLPPTYYLGDLKKQLEMLTTSVGSINAAALVEHIKAGRPLEAFIPPLDNERVARQCGKRIARFYGLNNKYHPTRWKKPADKR